MDMLQAITEATYHRIARIHEMVVADEKTTPTLIVTHGATVDRACGMFSSMERRGPGHMFASHVAASRIHDNHHYLSDVVFGAAPAPSPDAPSAVTAAKCRSPHRYAWRAAILYVRTN